MASSGLACAKADAANSVLQTISSNAIVMRFMVVSPGWTASDSSTVPVVD
jgi:hypothetical protein